MYFKQTTLSVYLIKTELWWRESCGGISLNQRLTSYSSFSFDFMISCVWMHVSVILQKIGPFPLAIQQQLLSELQQFLVALHQERGVIPADCLRTAEEHGVEEEVRWSRQSKTWINVFIIRKLSNSHYKWCFKPSLI